MFSIPYEGHRKKDQRYLNDRNSSIDHKYHADLYDGMTNNFLLTYGTDKVAAMGIALKVNMITALVLVGFAFGGQPLSDTTTGLKMKKD